MDSDTTTYVSQAVERQLAELNNIEKLLSGVITIPRSYEDISAEVQYLAGTDSWLSFYLTEAHRLKSTERPLVGNAESLHDSRQKLRFAHIVQFADQAVTAQYCHLSESGTRSDACLRSAIAGLVPHAPGLKMSTRSHGVNTFNKEIMERMGMADRVDVSQLHRGPFSSW